MSNDERTILVHLNVTPPKGDTRTADEIADQIVRAIWRGGWQPTDLGDRELDLHVTCTLAEEV